MRGKRIPTRPGKSWVKTRPERLADSKLPLALAKVDERKYAEDYTKTTWDPLSGRAPRPAAGSDGQFEHTHFMSQDNVSPSMDRSAWELGFEDAREMYPDSPVEDQSDIWVVRRIQPKYNPRLVNRKGWYDGYIYKDHEKTLIYESEHRLPAKVQSILNEMNLININDISLQFNLAEVNDLLWQIKSYVTIMPLRMPDGLPETEEELENFRLLSTGELINSSERLPKHVKQYSTNPAKGIQLNEETKDLESLKSGIDSRQMKFGHNLTQWQENWSFDENKTTPRRFSNAPKAWSSEKDFISRFCRNKIN